MTFGMAEPFARRVAAAPARSDRQVRSRSARIRLWISGGAADPCRRTDNVWPSISVCLVIAVRSERAGAAVARPEIELRVLAFAAGASGCAHPCGEGRVAALRQRAEAVRARRMRRRGRSRGAPGAGEARRRVQRANRRGVDAPATSTSPTARQRAHRQVRQERQVRPSWGQRGLQPGQFNTPHGIAIDAQGLVYVADHGNRRIQVFDGDGNFKTQFLNVGTPSALCITRGPRQFLYSSNSNPLLDLDVNGEIYKVDLTGSSWSIWPGGEAAQFDVANAIDCRVDNELWVGEIGAWRVEARCIRRTKLACGMTAPDTCQLHRARTSTRARRRRGRPRLRRTLRSAGDDPLLLEAATCSGRPRPARAKPRHSRCRCCSASATRGRRRDRRAAWCSSRRASWRCRSRKPSTSTRRVSD